MEGQIALREGETWRDSEKHGETTKMMIFGILKSY